MGNLNPRFFDRFSHAEPVPKFIEGETGTETLDLDDLQNEANSGSFYLSSMEAGFFGKLLHAFPIPSLLVDHEHQIIFANKACGVSRIYKTNMSGRPFEDLFPYKEHSDACKMLVDHVLQTRKTQVTTSLLQINGRKIWGRLHLRSMRAWQNRSALVLIEDLTLEKKQLILTKRHQDELRKAQSELELRVRERTVELTESNKLLRSEIQERRRAERELKLSRASFTSIVEGSKDGIVIVDQDGAVRYCNPAAWQFFGCSAEQLAAQRFSTQLDKNGIQELAIITPEGGLGTAEMHVTDTDWHGTPAYLAVLRDITERKSAEQALRENEHRYRQTFQRMRAVKLLIDPETANIVDANPAAAEFYGYTVEKLKSMNFTDVNSAPVEEVFDAINKSVSEQQNYYISTHVLASGETREVEIHTGPVLLNSGQLLNTIIHDITDRKRAEQKLHLAAKIIESSNEALITTDTTGRVIDVNQAFCKITGYSRDDVVGQMADVFQLGINGSSLDIWEAVLSTGAWQGEVWDKRKNGELYPKLLSVSAVKNNDGLVTHYVATFSDITKIKKAEKHLQHLAHFDPRRNCRTGFCSGTDCRGLSLLQIEENPWWL